MEKSNQTIRIDSIELRDAEYGRHLNDRLESINTNFETIISSDYLRGDDGVSVGVEPWVINTANLTSEEQTYIDQIIGAILKLNTGSGKNEQLAEGIKEYLNGKTIHLIKKETGELLSSLPFTYIDQRFSELKEIQDKDLENMFKDVRDLSCVIHYDNGEFKAIQSFPTIYWDSSLDGGDLCWMINGEKTGLSCRGPQGANGISGRMYTAFYDVNSSMQSVDEQSGEEHVAYHIVAVLTTKKVSSESKYENEYVYADEFLANGIDLNTGDTVIGIPCKFSNENGVKTITVAVDNVDNGLTVTDKTSTKYTISTVYVDQSTNNIYEKYVIVSDGKSVEIPLILENAHLVDLLKNAKLLYVPAKRSGEEISTGHAIWNEQSGDNNNNMCLGTIKRPDALNNESFELTDGDSTTIKNDIFNVGSKDCLVTKTQVDNNNLHIEQSANVAASQPVTVHNFDVIDTGSLPTGYPMATPNIGNMYFVNRNLFASCQSVEINTPTSKYSKYYTGVSTYPEGVELFIQWESFESFVEFVEDFREFLNSITPEDTRSYELPVKLGKLENLRIDESYNMWFADSFTDVNETTLDFSAELWINAPSDALSVGHVNNIKLADNGYFDYEIYWYHSQETRTIKSPILFDIEDYENPTSLPIKRRSESNDVDEVLYIAKKANSWTDIIVPSIKIENTVNQNEMLPYPAKRTKKYVNAGHYGKLIQDFDKYEGRFDEYAVNSSKAKIEGNEVDIVGDDVNIESQSTKITTGNYNITSDNCDIKSSEYRVNVTGVHHIEGETSLITTTNHFVDVESLHSSSEDLQQYFEKSRSGTEGVWGETNDNICSFVATEFIHKFSFKYLSKTLVASPYIPIGDLGSENEHYESRFRCVYEIPPFQANADRDTMNYFIIFTHDIRRLYNFLEDCINEYKQAGDNCDISSLFTINGVKAGFAQTVDGSIELQFAPTTGQIKIESENQQLYRLERNFEKIHSDKFVWNMSSYVYTGMEGDYAIPIPYIIGTNISPDEHPQFILCRSLNATSIGVEGYIYKLIRINDDPKYGYNSLIENIYPDHIADESNYGPNAYPFGNSSMFEHYAIPQSKLYESDGSSDSLRVDKIHRFCNEYNINGINLLDKIAELESRIQTLESRD